MQRRTVRYRVAIRPSYQLDFARHQRAFDNSGAALIGNRKHAHKRMGYVQGAVGSAIEVEQHSLIGGERWLAKYLYAVVADATAALFQDDRVRRRLSFQDPVC